MTLVRELELPAWCDSSIVGSAYTLQVSRLVKNKRELCRQVKLGVGVFSMLYYGGLAEYKVIINKNSAHSVQ